MQILLTSVLSLLYFLFSTENEKESISGQLASGIYNASAFGIVGNGTDMSEKINNTFALSNINTLVFDQPNQLILVNKTVHIPAGKIVCFKNNTRLVGNGAVIGGSIHADKHAWIFDKQLTILPADTVSQFSVKWYGAKGDGTTDDSEPIRATFEAARKKGGGNILFPAGVYIVSRQASRPFKIIPVYSNTKVKGEGMYVTSVKLAPSDVLNFRRVFSLGDSYGDVMNVEISDLGIDMSNPFKTYPPPASFGKDAQSAGIFCYGDPYVVKNAYFHDLFIHDVSGDVIVMSKNSKNVTVERIYQRDYLRQGIGIGGSGGVDSITVKHIYDLPFESGVQKGGNSIHTEPAALVKNVSYQYCRITDFSASGIDGLWIDSVTTTSSLKNACNNVKNFSVTRSVLNGLLQIAPTGPGTVKNNVLNKGLYFTSVGKGGFRATSDIFVMNNIVKDATGKSNIRITQVSGVTVTNNIIESNANAIEFANAGNGKAIGNKIKLSSKKFAGVSLYTTLPTRFGEGMFVVDSNVIDQSDKAIIASNVSCTIGNNNINAAGEKVAANVIGSAKVFSAENSNRNATWLNKVPQWGLWKKGDVIHVTAPGGNYDMICIESGALYNDTWNSSAKYQLNDHVKASDGNIYKAVASGAQAQDPVTDDGKYWVKVASTEARFKRQ